MRVDKQQTAMQDEFIINDIIGFKYNSRYVKGRVLQVDEKWIVLELWTDYIGKNEEWFSGEKKDFSKKAMKNITKHKK